MAITKGKKKSTTNEGSNKNNKNNASYKYSNSSVSLWSDETLLSISARKNEETSYVDLTVKINRLDEDRKFIKLEDGKYDVGFFSMTPNEAMKVAYGIKALMNGEISGVIINHISKDTNSGVQFEITSEDDGIYAAILFVEDGEATEESSYFHPLDNDQIINVYNNEGEVENISVNLGLLAILNVFESAYPLVGGLGEAVASLTSGQSSSGRSKNGGILKSKPRRTVGSKDALDDEDDVEENDTETDDEEEIKPAKKKKAKKKPLNGKNLKKLLEDDDDEE